VAFSPDGRSLASGSFDGTIILRDVTTDWRALSGHASHAGSRAFHPGGACWHRGRGTGPRVWDRTAGAARALPVRIGPASSQCVSVAWTREGRYLAVVRENRLACLFRTPPPAAD
jgi:WD40 repeat protein